MTNTAAVWTAHSANDSAPEGDIGGDIQVSEAWGAAFTLALPDGGEALIVVAYFVANMTLLEGDSSIESRDPHRDFIEEMTMLQIKNAAGEETWSDIAYDRVESVAASEGMCRELARVFDRRHITWDGTPTR